jgi:DNA-binding IscR family transcriptional regulator
MKINTKIRYGLRTMLEIAKAPDNEGILQKDIAKNQNISLKYLDSIISSLKLKGLIHNSKAPRKLRCSTFTRLLRKSK